MASPDPRNAAPGKGSLQKQPVQPGNSQQPSLIEKGPIKSPLPTPPSLSLPKGGAAIRGIGEKVDVSLSTGGGFTSIPIHTSQGRGGLQPNLSLSYHSGSGNGPFGLGWSLSEPSITRKTDKGLPRYVDTGLDRDSDVYLLAGDEDLVPQFKKDTSGDVVRGANGDPVIDEAQVSGYLVRKYAPRIDSRQRRIERWTSTTIPNDVYWRTISAENTVSTYGLNANSRIYDPNDASRIFTWLISEMYDIHGNAVRFDYKSEDSANVPASDANEANRTDLSRSANRYMKQIRYANMTPNRQVGDWTSFSSFQLPETNWKFSVIFDYGEHDISFPTTAETGSWACRADPFSTYKPGFEVRTYRLCQRILMFHHFAELGVTDCLVQSTDFSYSQTPTVTYLTSATQAGYALDSSGRSYVMKTLPPTDYEYAQFPTDDELSQLSAEELDRDNLDNAEAGLIGTEYQWLDLDGEGLQGMLSAQGEGWYYKRNTSADNSIPDKSNPSNLNLVAARFGGLESVQRRPPVSLAHTPAHFGNVSGSGKIDLISTEAGAWGYYERDKSDGWVEFKTFKSFPNIALDSNVQLVDLTGDGLADILIYADQIFYWVQSLGEIGYAQGVPVAQSNSEERGPIGSFSDFEQTIRLSDMSGDGLLDIVRIRDGDVAYWPNLGYGQFGSIIRMDNAPYFDHPNIFHENRVHLADIDGTGPVDLIYFGADGVDLFLNQSGNSFSDRKRLICLPPADSLSNISVLDLLGCGTSCILWNSQSTAFSGSPFRYVDITKSRKPHLLTKVTNNVGAETVIHYAPSTKFYLQDQEAGHPWITRLNFPVHCVEKIELFDQISGNRLVSSFSYHHGFWDHLEREFRGFAKVERWDAEAFATQDNSSSTNSSSSWKSPPVLTKTWFHTGAFIDRQDMVKQLSREFFLAPQNPSSTSSAGQSPMLGDSVISGEALLAADGLREAYRALRGQVIRVEIYSEDETTKASLPYSVDEKNFTISSLQPIQDAHFHSIFMVQPREALSWNYERNPADPQLHHNLSIDVDDYGNVLKGVSIAYGRRPGMTTLSGADKTKQETIVMSYTELDVTNVVDDETNYQLPKSCESRQYEVTGLSPAPGDTRFNFSDFTANQFGSLLSLPPVPYETGSDPNSSGKRLVSRSRVLFRSNDLTAVLPKGQIESMAIPKFMYNLCLTPGIISKSFQRISASGTENLLPSPANILTGISDKQCGYVDIDGDGNFWKVGEQIFFHPVLNTSPSTELAEAQAHFFMPRLFTDPFGNPFYATFDTYDLLPVVQQDALGNTSSAVVDYRVLQAKQITDVNNNRSIVAFDALGLVAGSAIMGKTTENLGDSLDGFIPDLAQTDIDSFFANPRGASAIALLGNATTRTVYDVDRFLRNPSLKQPVYSATISRDTHVSDPLPAEGLRVQISFSYSDGFQRSIQSKATVAAGPLIDGGPNVSNRWVGTGWTIFNNKGQPVRTYEPFFDDTHDFKFDMKVGVSPTTLYDPTGRTVAILHPDHAFDKVVFDPWMRISYDANDNVLQSDPSTDPDVGQYFALLPKADYFPSWYDSRNLGQLGADEAAAAAKTVPHANTPMMMHYDAIGRPMITIRDNGTSGLLTTREYLDIQNNSLASSDARGRIIVQNEYDMCSSVIHHLSMDSGERWILSDVTGKTAYSWNTRNLDQRSSYDALRRPLGSYLTQPGIPEILTQFVQYGETSPNSQALNLRGKQVSVQDQAGVALMTAYDFKGNILSSNRQLNQDYKNVIDWSNTVPLETDVFTTLHTYDALNRALETTSPDNSILHHKYDDGGHLYQVLANIKGEDNATDLSSWTTTVANIAYNSKGQTISTQYGNGAITTRTYDPITFRLKRHQTSRPSASGNGLLQDLNYTYDPIGNVSRIVDNALQTVYFRNTVVDPSCNYVYDPVYRLNQATGREHLAQSGSGNIPTASDSANVGLNSPGDPNAMARYTETYTYDESDNIVKIQHAGSDATKPGWTRAYLYNEPSAISQPAGSDPTLSFNNRLTSTSIGSTVETYKYDGNDGLHGNITSMPQLPILKWDFNDRLQQTSRQVVNSEKPETTYYVYDSGGQRVRKVTERQAASGTTPARLKERLYLGSSQLYREYAGDGSTVNLERESLEIMADGKRILLVESRTEGDDGSPARLLRYQFDNLIGSAALELDDQAQVISYEEYLPYGSTSYQAVRSQLDTPKRYRFTGKERDEESGLSFHGARYYASWIGRWLSPDPGGIKDGPNVFEYVSSNPAKLIDPSGHEGKPPGLIKAIYYYGQTRHLATDLMLGKATGNAIVNEVRVGLFNRVDTVMKEAEIIFEHKSVKARSAKRFATLVGKHIDKANVVSERIANGVKAGELELEKLSVVKNGVAQPLRVNKIWYVVRGASKEEFREMVVAAKGAAKAKGFQGTVHVVSENSARMQKYIRVAEEISKDAAWFQKGKAAVAAAGKVGAAAAGVAVVASHAFSAANWLGTAQNAITALDPSKSTGTRVVAALNVAATAAAYLPIPGAALVAAGLGIGLAFGGEKLASWIDKTPEPEHAPTSAPSTAPAPKTQEAPAPATTEPTHEEQHDEQGQQPTGVFLQS